MLSRALETNSYTVASGAGASYINPILWVRKIVEFARAKLVMEPLGWVDKTLVGQAGTTLNLQFNVEISAAAVSETAAITPSALSYTQVQFTPTEYAVAIALTRKQRIRSIQDIMEEKTKDMGYALAKLKDSNIFTALASSTISDITPNGVDVSAVASSDTFNTDIIADAIAGIRASDEDPKYIVIHPYQEKHLMKLSDFIDASVYGGREVVMNGEIGKYLGLKVLVSTQVPANGTTSTAKNAYVLAQNAFGVAYKMPVTFNMDYKVLEREFVLAAVEEYDVQLIRAARAKRIVTYGA